MTRQQLTLWGEPEPAAEPEEPRVPGATFEPEWDEARLKGQLARVYAVMKDGAWRTLAELGAEIHRRYPRAHDTESGIAARLRCLRRADHGGHIVESRRIGDPERGGWEYRVAPPAQDLACPASWRVSA
jgi:hypothetical protein